MSSHQTQEELFTLAPEALARRIRSSILDLFNKRWQRGSEELIEQFEITQKPVTPGAKGTGYGTRYLAG